MIYDLKGNCSIEQDLMDNDDIMGEVTTLKGLVIEMYLRIMEEEFEDIFRRTDDLDYAKDNAPTAAKDRLIDMIKDDISDYIDCYLSIDKVDKVN